MKHKIKVGKPITKNGKVVGYDDIQDIATNEVFRWNRRGYTAVPEGEAPAAPQQDKKGKKGKKQNTPKAQEQVQDLKDLTVKELRQIADPLGVKGKTKAALISAIEAARQDAGGE